MSAPGASETSRLLRCQGGYGSGTRIGRLVEASAFTHASALPGLRGPSALLRLQSDERLIALTRGGNHAAFEILCSRYHSRLLSFCRHMLASREDAEDVLQEVFAAAFNAVLADEREINVRPWLYRIARNRSLNHLRRATAVGVDSMDVHFADHGLSTSDRAIRRESFRELLSDVHKLPETQRTALLLREIDALSYEQIAHAMETTVPSVKSLLVRARISLAEAAEARRLSCEEVRHELGEAAEGPRPIVVSQRSQPVSVARRSAAGAHTQAHRKTEATSAAAVKTEATTPAAAPAAPAQAAPPPTSTAPQPAPTQVTEVTSETTQLPTAATAPAPPPAEGSAALPETAPPPEPPSTRPTAPAPAPAPSGEAASAPPAAPALPQEVASAPQQQTSTPTAAPAHPRHQRTSARVLSRRDSRAGLVQGKRLQRPQEHTR